MVILSPGIYIFCRHKSVLWPTNINTARMLNEHTARAVLLLALLMTKAFWQESWFLNLWKFLMELLTRALLGAEFTQVRSDHWSTLDWLTNFNWGWWRKFKFSSWHFARFGLKSGRLSVSWPCLSTFLFLLATWISPKKVCILQTCGLLQ